MLAFPQISGKALVQYPAQKTVHTGSSALVTRTGTRHALYDPAARVTTWTLNYEGLTELEARALETFFQQTEGRYRSFTFVDPFSNLLSWSVDLSRAVWNRGPSVGVSSGIADPEGGHAAAVLSNSSQVQGGIGQWIAAPAGFMYCVSAWLRGPAGSSGYLLADSAAVAIDLTGDWRRYEARVSPSSSPVRFGAEIAAGGSIAVYGLQAEAQLSASAYMPSHGPGGLHPSTRFDQDRIALEAHGPDDYRTSIRIVSGRQE